MSALRGALWSPYTMVLRDLHVRDKLNQESSCEGNPLYDDTTSLPFQDKGFSMIVIGIGIKLIFI